MHASASEVGLGPLCSSSPGHVFGNPAAAQLAAATALLRAGDSYSQVAMQQAAQLDRTFHALADGTRRAMIHSLARGAPLSAGELGHSFHSAQPTISKHLKVLEHAGLVERTIEGRVHRFRLRRKALREAESWLARHQAFWTGAVERLDRLLSEPQR